MKESQMNFGESDITKDIEKQNQEHLIQKTMFIMGDKFNEMYPKVSLLG